MRTLSSACKVGLTLILLAHLIGISTAHVHGLARARHALAARGILSSIPNSFDVAPIKIDAVSPCTENCVAAVAPSLDYTCDNGRRDIAAVVGGSNFGMICDVDYIGQNIYPFFLAGTFKRCVNYCTEYNEDHNETQCVGFVYAPERTAGADDCYLKSSINEPVPATIHLVGATLSVSTATSTATAIPSTVASADDASSGDDAPGELFWVSVADIKEMGSSTNKPTKKYISHPPYQVTKLSADLTEPGVNPELVLNYSMASDTGIWNSKSLVLKPVIKDIKATVQLARDGGKGGVINGTNVFFFCDTGVFSDGEFIDFVSSSVATGEGMNDLRDSSLSLVDHIGEWQDDVGRMRGFAPMTQGEEAYNKAVSGDGYRYAIWPESSPIDLNSSNALMYASLVYDEVDMKDQNNYNLTYFGNTILEISVDPDFGPYADRVVTQLYQADQIPFGSLGGFRAWGEQGEGGNDGEIMLFGKASDPNLPGVYAAKTTPQDFTDLDSYTYWNGHEWSKTMPASGQTEAAFFNESVVDFDMIYCPKPGTFIMIYTVYPPDNKFYYRELYPNSHHQIRRPWEEFPDHHWVDNIVTGNWLFGSTSSKVLYTVPTPAVGSMYAGGIHAGWCGDSDLTKGGGCIMLTWTEHTGKSGPEGYAHKSAKATITFGGYPGS